MRVVLGLSGACVVFLALSGCHLFKGKSKVKTDGDKASYAIGQQIGMGIKSQGLEVDPDFIASGIRDALSGAEPQVTQEEGATLLQALQQKANSKQSEKAVANLSEGDAYLAKNKERKEVTATESGLQYEVLAAGKGAKPVASDTVKVHYKGTLLDGTEFDSSYKRNEPAEFPLTGVIKGWTEGLQLMEVGAKYRFHIPAGLAYGERGRPSIPPNSVLIFDVELLEIVAKK